MFLLCHFKNTYPKSTVTDSLSLLWNVIIALRTEISYMEWSLQSACQESHGTLKSFSRIAACALDSDAIKLRRPGLSFFYMAYAKQGASDLISSHGLSC